MYLLLIRHGIAEEFDLFMAAGGTDAERPLTEQGRKKMRKAANRLRSQINTLDRLVTSPLLRARETAEIVSRVFGNLPLIERPELIPDSPPRAILAWLSQLDTVHTVALVGHEPHLGLLAGVLLANIHRPLIRFKKGGMALIECDTPLEAGTGTLCWALTPAQLRNLKDE